jgi:hypothetical protein
MKSHRISHDSRSGDQTVDLLESDEDQKHEEGLDPYIRKPHPGMGQHFRTLSILRHIRNDV